MGRLRPFLERGTYLLVVVGTLRGGGGLRDVGVRDRGTTDYCGGGNYRVLEETQFPPVPSGGY